VDPDLRSVFIALIIIIVFVVAAVVAGHHLAIALRACNASDRCARLITSSPAETLPQRQLPPALRAIPGTKRSGGNVGPWSNDARILALIFLCWKQDRNLPPRFAH